MEQKIFTVTELNQFIKLMLEEAFPEIWVKGEITNLKTAASGHTYFDLKDEGSVIASVFFKGYATWFKEKLENGMSILVRAQVTAYIKQGRYQLLVKEIKAQDTGSLHLAFEKLKKKLQDEGLFDESRKRPIPKFPSKIGLVTSLESAAIRDMLSILERRHSGLNILIAPVKVQGEGSKEEIARAIADLNRFAPELDVLLVGRGGGSMEDLWSFNEELVARAIACSKIPVISCVGHETDFTIADFVADLRAPTPSAAAELVVQNKEDIRRHLTGLKKGLIQSLKVFYENLNGRYLRLAQNRIFTDPMKLLESRTQRADDLNEKLISRIGSKLDRTSERLSLQSAKLNALSPYFPLAKGYALVKGPGGEVVKDAAVLKPGDKLTIQFKKGRAETAVNNTEK